MKKLTILSVFLLACGSDGTSASDAGDPQRPDGAPPDNMGVVPDPIPQSGVVYLAHWHTEAGGQDKLIWYRTDGATPRMEGEMDLGNPTQGMALDPVNNLLAFASDVGKNIVLYKIARPSGVDDPVIAPVEVGSFEYGDAGVPVAVFFSPYQRRVYISVSPTGAGVGEDHDLYAYDISASDDITDESWLNPIPGWPHKVPVSVYHATDSARGLLFIAGLVDDKLHVYDLNDDGLTPLPGDPLDLASLYPVPDGMTSQTGFQAREVRVDPWRRRVYVVRSQGILSEMMAFEYPADVPRFGAKYGDFAGMSDFQRISDAFDLNIASDQRPNLLDGYVVDIDEGSGAVFMSADAWNGTASTALVANFDASLQNLGVGCDEFEGFGCFVRYVSGNTPGTHLRTDGALCVDSAHQVVVATSVAPSEMDPGQAHFFKYSADLSMQRWNSEAGGGLLASSLPVEAACH